MLQDMSAFSLSRLEYTFEFTSDEMRAKNHNAIKWKSGVYRVSFSGFDNLQLYRLAYKLNKILRSHFAQHL